jgi:hypothetical protein
VVESREESTAAAAGCGAKVSVVGEEWRNDVWAVFPEGAAVATLVNNDD